MLKQKDVILKVNNRYPYNRPLIFKEVSLLTNTNLNTTAYLKNPTDPDSNNETSATPSVVADPTASTSTPAITTTADPSLAPAAPLPPNLGITASNGMANLSNPFNGFGEHNYEVFDPLNWLLDGVTEFPLNYPTISGLETQMS
jgi:hypothetical protein